LGIKQLQIINCNMKDILEYKIEIGTYSLSVYNIVAILVTAMTVWIFLKILKRGITHNRMISKARQYAISTLL
jgi:hypothetical protein